MAWGNTSRHERGYDSRWTKLVQTIRARDMCLCQACKREGKLTPYRKGFGFAVDHIVPKHLGGTDDPSNLELLCRACHAAKTEREAAAAQGRKVKTVFGLDGWPA